MDVPYVMQFLVQIKVGIQGDGQPPSSAERADDGEKFRFSL